MLKNRICCVSNNPKAGNPCLVMFFIARNCSFFMRIIFCSSVALVWTFNTSGVYNFITKEANIPVNLVPFVNDVFLFLFFCFITSGVTNELKSIFLWKQKSHSYLFETRQNFAAHKTLVWSTYVLRIATATIFSKKVIYELGSHLNRIRFI